MTHLKKHILFISFIMASSVLCSLKGQVTIGTNSVPAKGAIVDLKTQDPKNPATVTDDNNITSQKGGLVLPRVKLQQLDALTPFLTATENADKKERWKHAGLVVYNINNSVETETNPLKVFKPGVYMWDGERWSLLVREEFKFFHMPSFVLDISEVGTFTVDLYSKYIKQFAREGTLPADYPTLVKNPSALTSCVPNFKRSELDYYITYYDGSLVKDVSVSDDGLMKYTVAPTGTMDPYAYLSIVFVVK